MAFSDRAIGFDDGRQGKKSGMKISNESGTTNDVDPIDREAATIDARSDDAPAQIAELVEHADDVGRDW